MENQYIGAGYGNGGYFPNYVAYILFSRDPTYPIKWGVTHIRKTFFK